MKGFFSVVLLVAVLVTSLLLHTHHNQAAAAAAADSNLENNNTQGDRGCVGHHCLVADDVEADLFMDPYGLRRVLAGKAMPVSLGSLKGGKQSPDCKPDSIYGASSCLVSPQLNEKRPCTTNNYCNKDG